MSFRDVFLSDPLFVVLTSRGLSRAESYDACERVAARTADGEDEMAAVEAVLGFLPHSERQRLESLSKPPSLAVAVTSADRSHAAGEMTPMDAQGG